jgi:hypothetical protein
MVLRGERYSSWKHTRGSAYERAGIDTGSHPTPHKREPDTNDWMFRGKRRVIRGLIKVRRVERTGKDRQGQARTLKLTPTVRSAAS